ncbi:hypothetical protein R70723_13190 [Paenibacillus sp. FSL R7-0273]|nr:hypothetical protein R70723_13190 [Paenibacillus sp. FSL R7-0273]OMF97515.1 hypothetical protein BK144_02400 [Paenibacillus sp. FSL R7-0273]
MKSYWTVEELAKELQVTTRTIRNYMKSGELSGAKVGGQWRFTLSDIRKLTGDTGLNNPFTDFTENFNNPGTFQQSLLAFNIPVKSQAELEAVRDQIIEQYNQVYSGQDRRFYYELLSPDYFRVVLSGNRKYTLNFGSWIEERFY